LRYNNYYNRILKRHDTVADYTKYQIGQPLQNINFIPNDGIYARQVINWENEIPDYILVVDGTTINSRWFVIESKRNLAGQFELYLFRDTLADYYNEIQTAPMFVEKGILEEGNILTFNSENMTYNQIKTSETLLPDLSNSSWLVGYCDSENDMQYDNGKRVYYGESYFEDKTNIINILSSTSWEYYNNSSLVSSPTKIEIVSTSRNAYFNINARIAEYNIFGNVRYGFQNFMFNSEYGTKGSFIENTPSITPLIVDFDDRELTLNQLVEKANESFYGGPYTSNIIKSMIYTLNNNLNYQKYKSLFDNKIIYFQDLDRSYKVNFNYTSGNEYKEINLSEGTNQWNIINNIRNANDYIYGDVGNNSYSLIYAPSYITLELVPVGTNTSRLDFSPSNKRRHLTDSPYDMFAIPFSPIRIISPTGAVHVNQVNTEAIFSCVQEFARKQGVGNGKPLYDLQLLPYCPFPELIVSKGVVRLPGTDSSADYGKTYTNIAAGKLTKGEGDTPDVWEEIERIGVVIYCTSSSFTNSINITDPSTQTNKKIRSETELYRLVSPNYNGAFDFNAAKNDGLTSLNISCSYKPFTPFIQVAPEFGGLYGRSFSKENRGLICGGDFSMPIVTDTWSAYQQQNRNYQAIFDRQIENMEIQNQYQRTQDIFNAVTGSIQGGVSGAMTGAAAGPWGAVAGAVVGTAASTAGGIIDYQMKETLRNEAIDYSKDQFGYQLGNIKALPDSLSKISAFNINNKIFPALEYYCASQEEINALINKIKYNGMTVMVIGNIQEFSSYKPDLFSRIYEDKKYTYIKGKIIDLDLIHDDYHIVNTIAGELNKGVFI